jgi:hypothetical protein
MQQNQIQQIKNATIVTSEYTDKNTGAKKKSYLTIGKLFIYQDGGMSLKLDALPLHGQSINFYDIKPKEQNTPRPQNNQQGYNPNQPPPQQQQQNYNNGNGGYQQ